MLTQALDRATLKKLSNNTIYEQYDRCNAAVHIRIIIQKLKREMNEAESFRFKFKFEEKIICKRLN